MTTTYERPGIRSKILAIVLRVIPKVPEAERMFIDSFEATLVRYRGEYRLADAAYARFTEKVRQRAQR